MPTDAAGVLDRLETSRPQLVGKLRPASSGIAFVARCVVEPAVPQVGQLGGVLWSDQAALLDPLPEEILRGEVFSGGVEHAPGAHEAVQQPVVTARDEPLEYPG